MFIIAVKQCVINFRTMKLKPIDNNIEFSNDYKKEFVKKIKKAKNKQKKVRL